MTFRRTTTALIATLALAAPQVALADGAGDQQYENPLPAPAPKKKPKATAPAAVAPAAAAAPAQTAAPASSTTAAAPAGELPRTGAPAGLVALAGAFMAATGLALRRRLPTA